MLAAGIDSAAPRLGRCICTRIVRLPGKLARLSAPGSICQLSVLPRRILRSVIIHGRGSLTLRGKP